MKIENYNQLNNHLHNLIAEIKLLYPKITIVIGGSWQRGEPLIINGYLKSDLDFYLLTSWRDFLKILKNKKQLLKIKKNIIKLNESDEALVNNLPSDRRAIKSFNLKSVTINLHLIPYFFLKHSFYQFHGQVASQGRPKVIHLLNRGDSDKTTLINCLKRGYLELIKAYLNNDNVALAKSAKNIAVGLIIKNNQVRSGNLFQLKNLILLINYLTDGDAREKKLLIEILSGRLNNQLKIYQTADWQILRQIINRLYLTIGSAFAWRHWLLYNFYFLPKKNLSFLFKNPNKLILQAEYCLANSFQNVALDQNIFKKSWLILNKIEKYCNIVFVI